MWPPLRPSPPFEQAAGAWSCRGQRWLTFNILPGRDVPGPIADKRPRKGWRRFDSGPGHHRHYVAPTGQQVQPSRNLHIKSVPVHRPVAQMEDSGGLLSGARPSHVTSAPSGADRIPPVTRRSGKLLPKRGPVTGTRAWCRDASGEDLADASGGRVGARRPAGNRQDAAGLLAPLKAGAEGDNEEQ